MQQNPQPPPNTKPWSFFQLCLATLAEVAFGAKKLLEPLPWDTHASVGGSGKYPLTILLWFLFHPCMEKNPRVPFQWKLNTRVCFRRKQWTCSGCWHLWAISGVTPHPWPSGLVISSAHLSVLEDKGFFGWILPVWSQEQHQKQKYSLQEWLRAALGTRSCWWQDWEDGVWVMGWVQNLHHHQHKILNCFPCKMSTFWFPARNWSSRRWEQFSNLISSNEVNSFWVEELSWKLWQFITCSKLIKLQGRRKDQKIACYWHN